jgi:hypothetical protein
MYVNATPLNVQKGCATDLPSWLTGAAASRYAACGGYSTAGVRDSSLLDRLRQVVDELGVRECCQGLDTPPAAATRRPV